MFFKMKMSLCLLVAILLVLLSLHGSGKTIKLLHKRRIPSGSHSQTGYEKPITKILEEQLKYLEPELLKMFSNVSDKRFPIEFIRPITWKYNMGPNGLMLLVKYQVDAKHYFHVKFIHQNTNSQDFKIKEISNPKLNNDPLGF